MAQPSHRDQLIRGAMKCLRTKGFARTTARDIAAASNANLASIGYHFGSKEALLNEALIRMFKRRNLKVGEGTIEPGSATPLEQLTSIFVAAGRVLEAPRPLFVAFVEAIVQADHSPELREQMAQFYREARAGIATTIRTMIGDSAHLDGQTEAMATMLMALFDGLVLQWLLDPDAVTNFEELFGALVTTMRAVLADDRSARTRKKRGTVHV